MFTGILACHSDADCEENAKCFDGYECVCTVAKGNNKTTFVNQKHDRRHTK